MSTQNREELRKKIDEDIAALFERIRCLYASRNTLALVNSLPSEVLGRIFLLIRDFSSHNSPTSKNYLDWLSVTRVSQLWRQVSIGYASLWTQLPSRNENFLQLCLARSRACPISIDMRITKKNLPFFRSTLKSLPRIQNLHLVSQTDHWNKIVSGLRFPALELKELAISGKQVFHLDAVSWPEDLFGGNAPHLRHLTISEFPFQGYLPAFIGLTALCLDKPKLRTPLAIILRALGQMPNLEAFTVKECFTQELSEDDDMDVTSLFPVVMPHLNEVTISSPDSAKLVLFFRSLQFLKSPSLDFQYIFGDGTHITPDSLARLLPILQKPYQNGMTSFSRMRIGASRSDFLLAAWDRESNIILKMKMHCREENLDLHDDFRDWFSQCPDHLLAPVESLELFSIGSLYFFDNSEFDILPRLQHITIIDQDEGGGLTEFLLQNFDWHCDATKADLAIEAKENEELHALMHVDSCSEGESWDEISLPALETMTFRRSFYNIHDHEYWVQTLRARKRHGYGPKKIILEKCYGVTAAVVKELGAIVEVEWDKFGL
ncbi:hypothetical protein BDN72DRAFT_841518 [Pluteus cervinus]|uniref:Uncharacterized protein n=1 Tax=Pluteus cervinus TaxID=181527 RepID=A0ACD3ARN9_9AGAR|nr:hypothetical protein BDN72DRAFT_841518 [Pluteus cervinus]